MRSKTTFESIRPAPEQVKEPLGLGGGGASDARKANRSCLAVQLAEIPNRNVIAAALFLV